jgi:hypothetical protein
VGGAADPPTRYEVHGSSLTAVQEPGFVVRGFLWCASKSQPQLDPELKEVHKLDGGKWPDQETRTIVSISEVLSTFLSCLGWLRRVNEATMLEPDAFRSKGLQLWVMIPCFTV